MDCDCGRALTALGVVLPEPPCIHGLERSICNGCRSGFTFRPRGLGTGC
jgi:hypothetical protein